MTVARISPFIRRALSGCGIGSIVAGNSDLPTPNRPSKIAPGGFDVSPRPQPRLVETVLILSIVLLGLLGATAMLAEQAVRCLPLQ